jgi:hypothetical protein
MGTRGIAKRRAEPSLPPALPTLSGGRRFERSRERPRWAVRGRLHHQPGCPHPLDHGPWRAEEDRPRGLEAHQDDRGRHLTPQRAVHALLEDRRVSGVPRTASDTYSSGVRECGTPEVFVGTMPSAPVRAFMRGWFARPPFHCHAPSGLGPCARGRLEILPVLAFPRYGSRSVPQSRFRSMWVRSITGPLGKGSRVAHELRNDVPGSPTRTTGVPDKLLRTLAGRLRRQSAQINRKLPVFGLMTPCKEPTGVPSKDYRGAQQGLPGCPARTTGVPSKDYRGAQQGLPGCPARTTGVPNKPLS